MQLALRFRDLFINQTELTTNGKIGMLPIASGDSLMQKFTHMLEEYGARGGILPHVAEEARKPLLRYFENGDPIAIKMFSGYDTSPSHPILVKYGQQQFLKSKLCSSLVWGLTSIDVHDWFW